MAAAMNGMALHGGIIPYGGTFLVFTDYCRPAIRLAALMGQRVIYVMTHDFIGLGEDGPTHQPVEHLAALRAMPNLLVFRPADAVETAECWELALANRKAPSILALTRQNAADAAHRAYRANLCAPRRLCARARPRASAGDADRHRLRSRRSRVTRARSCRPKASPPRVVSMPCWELFDRQPHSLSRRACWATAPCASPSRRPSPFGWERYIGADGGVRRHDRASAPRRRRRISTSISASPPKPRSKPRLEANGCQTEGERVMAVEVAINGFGRIGRLVLRAIIESGRKDIEVVAHQRSRPGRDQRASAALRHRAWPLPRRGEDAATAASMPAAAG